MTPMIRVLMGMFVFCMVGAFSSAADLDQSKQLSQLKLKVIKFVEADIRGDVDVLYPMLCSHWKRQVRSAKDLHPYVFSAFKPTLDKGTFEVRSISEERAGRKIAKVNLLHTRKGEESRAVVYFILVREDDSWNVLFASPSSMQPLFQSIFDPFLEKE